MTEADKTIEIEFNRGLVVPAKFMSVIDEHGTLRAVEVSPYREYSFPTILLDKS